jgi:hypothetical protein
MMALKNFSLLKLIRTGRICTNQSLISKVPEVAIHVWRPRIYEWSLANIFMVDLNSCARRVRFEARVQARLLPNLVPRFQTTL